MRALAYFAKNDIHFSDEIPEPTIGVDDELIIDISFTGICGSDLHEYLDGPIFFPEDNQVEEISGIGLPQPMGHEMSGVVSKVGPAVTKVNVGDRVVVEATGTCRDVYRWPNSTLAKKDKCAACKKGFYNCCGHLGFCGLGAHGGGFAEKVVTSEKHVVKLPDNIPMDVAALVEPISVAWHAVHISGLKPGQCALVLGGGPIGLATVLALQGHKAGRIVVSEPAKARREQAAAMGVETFNPIEFQEEPVSEVRKLGPDGDGFEYSFDCAGVKETFDASVHALTFRGTAVNIAIWGHKPVDFHPMDVTLQEKFVTGSMCYTIEDFEAVVKAMHEGGIDIEKAKLMITGRQKIEDGFEKGFQELIKHKERNIKILLTPNNFNELT